MALYMEFIYFNLGGSIMTFTKTGKSFFLGILLFALSISAYFFFLGKGVRADESGNGWTLSADGALTITSDDAFSSLNVEWTPEDVREVIIADTVTSLPRNAFKYHYNLEHVTLGSGTTTIGDSAFANCTSLKEINLTNVSSLDMYAFSKCSALETVIMGSSIKAIKFRAFEECTNLSSIDLSHVESIAGNAFRKCESLRSVDLSNCVIVESSAFEYCTGITSLDLSGVRTIERSAFIGCTSLKTVSASSNVTSIGAYAFKNCTSLTTLDFRSASGAYEDAFRGCTSLVSIDLSSATIIDLRAFYGCSELSSVTLGDKCKSIGKEAFQLCKKLNTIDLSHTETISENAFGYCSGLTEIDLSSATTIGRAAFTSCSGLISVLLGDSVTEINAYTFDGCSSLTTINLEKLEVLFDRAFRQCTSLTYADIRNLNDIPYEAFSGCTSLKTLVFGANDSLSITVGAFESNKVTTILFYGSNNQLKRFRSFFKSCFPNATCYSFGFFDVVFDYGNNVTSSLIVEEGKPAVRPEQDPTSQGKTFSGWYADKSCSIPYDFNKLLHDDVTIYAGWMKSMEDTESIFRGYTLTLDGTIGVNYYTVLPDGNTDTDYMLFTVEGLSGTQTVYAKDAKTVTANGVTYSVFTCRVPARNMTSPICAEYIAGGQTIDENTYSIKQYAQYIFDNQTQYAKAVPLVRAMLNYGAYAQLYFGYNEDDLANEGIDNGDYSITSTLAEFGHPYFSNLTHLPEALHFNAVSLTLDSDTVLSLRFDNTLNQPISFFLFDNGRRIELPQEVDGEEIIVRIEGIPAHKLRERFKIVVAVSGESEEYYLEYSPMTYAHNVLYNDPKEEYPEELKNLMKAFHLYNMAALQYVR